MTKENDNVIGFAPELVPLVLSGEKTLTYRLGDKYSFLQVNDRILTKNSKTGRVFAELEIVSRETGTFANLRDDRDGHEMYRSTDERRKTFEKYYGREVYDDETAIILGFKVVKKIDFQTPFIGVIIEESLTDNSVLKDVRIVSTKVERVTEKHKTLWVKQWTVHTVEIPEEKAAEFANSISKALDSEHNWYADFKTETEHYVIYTGKVFHITDRTDKEQYDKATKYGISIGIPDYQVDFSPHLKKWKR